jgi:hypothetical protein
VREVGWPRFADFLVIGLNILVRDVFRTFAKTSDGSRTIAEVQLLAASEPATLRGQAATSALPVPTTAFPPCAFRPLSNLPTVTGFQRRISCV